VAATAVKRKAHSAVDVIREQHWLELGDYLGQKPSRIRSTMELWFGILAELGYELVATGANRQTPRPQVPAPAPPAPEVTYIDMYHAVEDALIDVAGRRTEGERISDQAEVRTIVAKVLACIADTTSGKSPDDHP
jgi:hypothetical protein